MMIHRSIYLTWLFLALLALAIGCAPTGDDPTEDPPQAEEHDDEAEHGDRIPNEGAVIRIVSPADGATFAAGDEVVVAIETENFPLGEGHWHIFVDGESWGMVEGGNTDEVLRGLEPGEREIEVVLSTAEHVELEEGDHITIHIGE
jgi:hypothetical protein